jgi:hypothetical protein
MSVAYVSGKREHCDSAAKRDEYGSKNEEERKTCNAVTTHAML